MVFALAMLPLLNLYPPTIHHPQDLSWPAAKRFIGNVDAFLKSLLSFDKENIPMPSVEQVGGGKGGGLGSKKKKSIFSHHPSFFFFFRSNATT